MKTPPWTQKELKQVLSSLKSNKCRDPNGMINEIFKPGVIGADLQIALLDLFNLCKSQMQIPNFMQVSDISNIWKMKGDKLNIESYRGIFIVNIFRSLLMRLIHQDKADTIDSNMSDFQIDGRKTKKCEGPYLYSKWSDPRGPQLSESETN